MRNPLFGGKFERALGAGSRFFRLAANLAELGPVQLCMSDARHVGNACGQIEGGVAQLARTPHIAEHQLVYGADALGTDARVVAAVEEGLPLVGVESIQADSRLDVLLRGIDVTRRAHGRPGCMMGLQE